MMRVAPLFLMLLAGCGSKDPKSFTLQGEALFDGQPIVFGDVVFTPDATKGHTGPQGFANIRDGRYDTTAANGRGVAGGPTIVRVTGLAGPKGPVICEYEYPADIPAENGTFKIEVPGKGAVKTGKGPGI